MKPEPPPPTEADPRIDALLRDWAHAGRAKAQAQLANDSGFTASVMRSLPAAKMAKPRWATQHMHQCALAVAAVLACALIAFTPESGNTVWHAFSWITDGGKSSAAANASPVVWAASAAFALAHLAFAMLAVRSSQD